MRFCLVSLSLRGPRQQIFTEPKIKFCSDMDRTFCRGFYDAETGSKEMSSFIKRRQLCDLNRAIRTVHGWQLWPFLQVLVVEVHLPVVIRAGNYCPVKLMGIKRCNADDEIKACALIDVHRSADVVSGTKRRRRLQADQGIKIRILMRGDLP